MYGLPMINKLNELNIYYCYDGMDTQRHNRKLQY
jgi:hypothetical protein